METSPGPIRHREVRVLHSSCLVSKRPIKAHSRTAHPAEAWQSLHGEGGAFAPRPPRRWGGGGAALGPRAHAKQTKTVRCRPRTREIVRPARTGSCWCENTPCASRCGFGFQAAAACGLPATAKDLVASTSIFLRIASLLVRSLWESRVLSAVLVMAHAFST